MRSNEYGTVLSVGRYTPFGTFATSGASFVLDGHSVAMLVNQLPRREHYADRNILEYGAIEVALLTEGVSALLAWRWKTGETENDLLAVDTPFHIGLEDPPHRHLPLIDDGRIPLVLVTQDHKGRCVSMRHGAIGSEVTSALVQLRRHQLADIHRSDFEVQHRRNIRSLMQRLPDPLTAFNAAEIRSTVAAGFPFEDLGTRH
ncbi:hypothetical protein [Devosia sp.]|uniref:hypothetical protein n=1 Tax=Devosia sp. TaxID=1871048 RepID=UPI001B2C3ECE|nr:hypothetical protein [Devosia sp.]MBO9591153.1 hypothetical protein [Devosia sp.]